MAAPNEAKHHENIIRIKHLVEVILLWYCKGEVIAMYLSNATLVKLKVTDVVVNNQIADSVLNGTLSFVERIRLK